MLNCSSPAWRWVERTLQARQARPGHPKAVVLEPSPTGEARSRHTKAVVPGLVPGTQCPSRLKALPIRDGAFAAVGDAIVERHRHALLTMGAADTPRGDSGG